MVFLLWKETSLFGWQMWNPEVCRLFTRHIYKLLTKPPAWLLHTVGQLRACAHGTHTENPEYANALLWLSQVTEDGFGQSAGATPTGTAQSCTLIDLSFVNIFFSVSIKVLLNTRLHGLGDSPPLWGCMDIFTHPTNEERKETLGLSWCWFPERRP